MGTSASVTMAEDQDVVDLLLAQHNEIKSLFSQVAAASGGQKRELFEKLVRLLAVHESAEEQVVHPTAKRTIASGDQIVADRLHEEDTAKHELAKLYEMGVNHPQFDADFDRLCGAVLDHAMHEEQDEFPYLRQNLDAKQLRRMGEAVRAAEAMAPTRPHPAAGESAPANLLAGPPLAIFDRARDAVRAWNRARGD